ncbi:MAG: DUF362 domain-containing protein [Bacillota bacterium]
MGDVLFASAKFQRYDADAVLTAKFGRLIDRLGMDRTVKGKWTAIKMHLGRHMIYSTIHPIFIRILVDKLKSYGAKVYITDQDISGAAGRGYTAQYLEAPLVYACGVTGKYYYERPVDFKSFRHVDIAGNIHDADVMINLAHVKGHGCCGFAGACKNIAMGCVTDRTRGEIHSLEGGLVWDENLCTRCEMCVRNCNHHANRFNDQGKYEVFFHHCTYCQHCVKVCPGGAIRLNADHYEDFQTGMAVCTEEVLKSFAPGHVFHINFLTDITALCDCWGFTTPSLVPDIGIMASGDLVAVERASIDAIKVEDFIPAGMPAGYTLKDSGHLLERLHGKSPFVQLKELEKRGLGREQYRIEEVF